MFIDEETLKNRLKRRQARARRFSRGLYEFGGHPYDNY